MGHNKIEGRGEEGAIVLIYREVLGYLKPLHEKMVQAELKVLSDFPTTWSVLLLEQLVNQHELGQELYLHRGRVEMS